MRSILLALSFIFGSIAAPLRAQSASAAPSPSSFGPPNTRQDDVGRVVGRVLDAGQGGPLAGVEVVVQGTFLQTVSGVDGRYALPRVPAGNHELAFRRIGYKAKRVAGVEVPPGGAVELNATLEAQVVQLEEVVVTSAAAERGSVSKALEEQRLASNIINAVSMAQIEKSPDGDAGQVAQRVSGVTVQDGKYVFVRGLGERYTTTSLNGARVPSPEPERREVPLDLFPANLLDGITTSKTFTPDQPGDFSGAEVNLKTREFPLRRTLSMSVSTTVNDAIVGQSLLAAPTVGREWAGFGGGERQLPAAARNAGNLSLSTLADLNAITASFRDAWSALPATGSIAGSMGLSLGGEDPIAGLPIGYVGSFTYSYGPEIRGGERRAIAVGATGGGVQPQNEFSGSTARASALWGGVLNLTARVGGGSKVSFNNMYNRGADNEVTHLQGTLEEFSQIPYFDVTRLTFTERSVRSNQIAGQHLLKGRHELEWAATFSGVTRDEPDRSDLVYEAQRSAPTGAIEPVRWWGAPRSATRNFSSLSEDGRDLRTSLRLVGGSPGAELALKVGGEYRHRHRTADSRAFDIVNLRLDDPDREQAAERIFDGTYAANGDLFLSLSANGGSYLATDDNVAGFGQLEIPLGSRVRVLAGGRVEQARLDVQSTDPGGVDSVRSTLDNTDLLPALSVNVSLSDNQNLRLSGSQTLSRPEYRELSPVTYFDVIGGLTVFGNPNLKRALIQNADLRWEWFPRLGEVVSLGIFAKRFINPIEQVIVATSGAPRLGFVNAEAANNYGAELELRKSLEDISQTLSPFSVFSNVTLMHSKITPGNDSISTLTSANRAMVGQAGYVVNAGLGYAHPRSSLSATILYNVVGRRISEAGVGGLPDTYDEARQVLDASLRIPLFGVMSMKLDAKNLLDAPYKSTQGTVLRESYFTGRSFAVGFSWSSAR